MRNKPTSKATDAAIEAEVKFFLWARRTKKAEKEAGEFVCGSPSCNGRVTVVASFRHGGGSVGGGSVGGG